MQKRSTPLEIVYTPIRLSGELPITGSNLFVQTDRPITFLHVHDCLELGYCHSGNGVFVVGEKVLPFSEGDVSFINHTEVHLARSAPGTRSKWTWIYLDPVRLIPLPAIELGQCDPTPFAGPAFNNIISGAGNPAVNRVVHRMVEELDGRTNGHESVLRALAWELMVLMNRLSFRAGEFSSRAEYDRIAPALQFLAQEYHRPLRTGELARRCAMSEPHFRRVFGRVIGRSPRDYWNNLRLRMAASLLQGTSRSVLEISHDVGFDTLSSFNRLFLSHFRVSPREWRRRRE